MATIQIYGEQQTLALANTYCQQAYPGKSVKSGTFLGQQCVSLSQLVGAIQTAVLAANNDGIPATTVANGVIQSQCSTQAVDQWAQTFGLPSNRGPGLFGRNGAVVAKGGGGQVTGLAGTVVPANALLSDPASQQQVELVAGVTVPVGLTIAGSFQAVTPGNAGNLSAGTVLYWVSPVPGLSPSVTLTTALSGGYDSESDLDLILRLLAHLRDPPKGGTARDYRVWAEESTDLSTGASLGIFRAYVYPRRSGLGTEDICITTGGSGKGRDPDNGNGTPIVTPKVQASIDFVRPVNDSPTAIRPYFNPAQKLSIELLGKATTGYPWDWTMSGGITIVASSTTTITVSESDIATGVSPGPGAQLAAAIAAGRQPRIQVLLPAQSPLPFVVQVASAAPPSGGNVVLTLVSALPAAPSGLLCPGGGAVMPVAIAVLAYVDQVGPSQQSGFADMVTDSWEAVVSIGRIAQAALDARGQDGNRCLVYSPSVGTGVGVTIAVGSGAAGAADFQLWDNVPGQGPQLPEVAQILVLPA